MSPGQRGYRKLQRALRRAQRDLPEQKDDGAAPSHTPLRARSGPEPAAEDETDGEPEQDNEPVRTPSLHHPRAVAKEKTLAKPKTLAHPLEAHEAREDFSTLRDDLDLGLPDTKSQGTRLKELVLLGASGHRLIST